MSQKDDILIEEWLKNNKVIVLPEIKQKQFTTTVSSKKKSINDLPSIGEAIDMYGEKQKRKVKEKIIDVSSIDTQLIPESLHSILNLFKDNQSVEEKN